MKLSVIIVNYNVRHFLEQTLLSVRKAAQKLPVEIFVVDNNSVDDSVRMVREKFPEVQVIANADNPGFSIANNQAIRQAKGKYVLLLNPDTVVEENTFVLCYEFMENHSDAGALGVRMIDGGGAFLPESKRGFPSPWVAFSKTFGLAKFFPKSRLFNAYHLGFLDEHENYPVDVLSGAFMFIRMEALNKVGLLDEAFFMYGEDIDLSYRIIKGGYQNYYFSDTSIIHYKGESTKKGSLNYVKAFYQAMIIFARKHFQGPKARLFVLMLQGAIYLRAAITLMSNFFQKLSLPIVEGLAIYGGLLFLKNFWANYHFHDPNYYPTEINYINFPLYVLIWLGSVFFAGGYDEKFQLRRLLRGLVTGTLLLAAIYGFLDLEYRSSRALILLGAAWAFLITIFIRLMLHFIQYKSFNIGRTHNRRLIFVGEEKETIRARQLLQNAEVQSNVLGRVAPKTSHSDVETLGHIGQLEEIVRIYKIEEIIFCSRDLSTQSIMHWMSKLGPQLLYKILPEDSLSIIGSHSKNTGGELYTIDIQFNIAKPLYKRNKRLFDLLFSLFLLLTSPIQLFLVKNPLRLFSDIVSVLTAQKTWVAYPQSPENQLPNLKKGVLQPASIFYREKLNDATIHRLNSLYAKDYQWFSDLEICWKALYQFRRNATP